MTDATLQSRKYLTANVSATNKKTTIMSTVTNTHFEWVCIDAYLIQMKGRRVWLREVGFAWNLKNPNLLQQSWKWTLPVQNMAALISSWKPGMCLCYKTCQLSAFYLCGYNKIPKKVCMAIKYGVFIITTGTQGIKEEAWRDSGWTEKGAVSCRAPVTEKYHGDQGSSIFIHVQCN